MTTLKFYLDRGFNQEGLFFNESKSIEDNMGFSLVVPNGNWKKEENEYWKSYRNINAKLIKQGWKIHISANFEQIDAMLEKYSDFCFKNNISFKHLRSKDIYLELNHKHSARISSGKFITIYPESSNHFQWILYELENIDKNFAKGPYILTDNRWKNTNIYFRYGAFIRRTEVINGRECDVILAPDGSFVEDVREPSYNLPYFISEPKWLMNENQTDLKIDFSYLDKFDEIIPIQHSNGGGVYLVKNNNHKYILKEGRFGAGIDKYGFDSFKRNLREYEVLKSLASIECVINVIETEVVWEHSYFLEEYFEGISLQDFIAQQYPFSVYSTMEERESYLKNILMIFNQLKEAIYEIHNLGLAIVDLSFNNILVNKNLKIKLIDFEAVEEHSNKFDLKIATPGFVNKDALNFLENDYYALHKILIHLMVPIQNLYELSPNHLKIHKKYISNFFGDSAIIEVEKFENEISQNGISFLSYNDKNKSLMPLKDVISASNIDKINFDTDYLFEGNIESILSKDNVYNFYYGFSGIIFQLIDNVNKNTQNDLTNYIKQNIVNVVDEAENIGLFDGISGFLALLSKLEFKEQVYEILNNNIFVQKLEDYHDFSLESGLSGYGLFLLSILNTYNFKNVNINLVRVNNLITRKIIELDEIRSHNFGLLNGWAGVALFKLYYAYKKKSENEFLIFLKIMNKIIDKIFIIDKQEDKYIYHLRPEAFKDNVISTYIKDGIHGLLFLVLKYNELYPNEFDNKIKDLAQFIIDQYISEFSGTVGIMRGYSGVVLNLFYAKKMGFEIDDKILSSVLNNLKNYLILSKDSIYCPGDFNIKCSLNFYSGSAGIISVLKCIKNNDYSYWLPLKFKEEFDAETNCNL